jgi:hypothetical protein
MQDAPPAKLEDSAAIERDAKKARRLFKFAKPNLTLPDDIRELGRWTPERGDALYKDLVENLPSMDLVRALLERDREVFGKHNFRLRNTLNGRRPRLVHRPRAGSTSKGLYSSRFDRRSGSGAVCAPPMQAPT